MSATATSEPRVLTPAQIAQRKRTAWQKAVDGAAWENVKRITLVDFEVTGSRGDTYLVSLCDPDNDGEPTCTCPAGFHYVPCWHTAAAAILAAISEVPPSMRDMFLESLRGSH